MTGNILGYDLNEKNCQISFYSEAQQEPQTMELVADNYQIPLVLGRKGDVWLFGLDIENIECYLKFQIKGGNIIFWISTHPAEYSLEYPFK